MCLSLDSSDNCASGVFPASLGCLFTSPKSPHGPGEPSWVSASRPSSPPWPIAGFSPVGPCPLCWEPSTAQLPRCAGDAQPRAASGARAALDLCCQDTLLGHVHLVGRPDPEGCSCRAAFQLVVPQLISLVQDLVFGGCHEMLLCLSLQLLDGITSLCCINRSSHFGTICTPVRVCSAPSFWLLMKTLTSVVPSVTCWGHRW